MLFYTTDNDTFQLYDAVGVCFSHLFFNG